MAAFIIIAIAILFFYLVLKIGGLLDGNNSHPEQPSRPTPSYSHHTIRDTTGHNRPSQTNKSKGCDGYLNNPFGVDGKEFDLVGMQYRHLEDSDYGISDGVAFAETDNPYDKYAISIRYSANEKTVAYLPKENKQLHEYILSVGGQTPATFKIWTIDGNKIYGLAYVEVKPYTTKEELEGYEIVREICSEIVDKQEIGYKDTHTYLTITLGASTRNTICLLYLNTGNKYIEYASFVSVTRKYIKTRINNIGDIWTYRTDILDALNHIKTNKK